MFNDFKIIKNCKITNPIFILKFVTYVPISGSKCHEQINALTVWIILQNEIEECDRSYIIYNIFILPFSFETSSFLSMQFIIYIILGSYLNIKDNKCDHEKNQFNALLGNWKFGLWRVVFIHIVPFFLMSILSI